VPRGNSGLGIVGTMSPNRRAAVSRGRAKGGRGVRSPADLPGRGPGKADAPGHRNRDSLVGERAASGLGCSGVPDFRGRSPHGQVLHEHQTPPPLRANRIGGILHTSPCGTRHDPLHRGGLIECYRRL